MLFRILRRALFTVGIVTLGYAGVLVAESYVTQHYETLKFDRALALPPNFRRDAGAARGGPIGKLTIPSVHISAIVLEGADAKTLNAAPGHIPETALPGETGNVAIAGHRDTFFRNLEKIRVGDLVTLATLGGDYQYKVVSLQVVDPGRTDVLAPTREATLTLVTCYPFHMIGPAPMRFIVRGRLVQKIVGEGPHG